jgi:magnesium transporter
MQNTTQTANCYIKQKPEGVIAMKVLAVKYSASELEIVNLSSLKFSPSELEIVNLASLEDIHSLRKDNSILWLDVSEYQKSEELYPLQKEFNLHPLALEDCFNIRQRPKIDDFHDNLFLICRTVNEKEGIYAEGQQLGIFLGKNFLITVHSQPIPELNYALEDIKREKNRPIEGFSSFLLYTISDNMVDNLENAVKHIEEMESIVGCDVLKDPPPKNILDLIYKSRSNLLLVGRLLRPQRDVTNSLAKRDSQLIDKETVPFFNDTKDHVSRTLDRIDSLLDMNTGSLNIYSTSVSSRMNQVMRFLTVISTIGVPLTILVGWYGMNFRDMPEVYWAYGYTAVIVTTIGIILATVLLFKKKGWL